MTEGVKGARERPIYLQQNTTIMLTNGPAPTAFEISSSKTLSDAEILRLFVEEGTKFATCFDR